MLRSLYALLPPVILKLLTVEVRAFREVRDARLAPELPLVELTPQHIANLKVLTDRRALLQALPSDAVVAEIGVARGDFSEAILQLAAPKELHLIDAWSRPREYRGLRKVVERRFVDQISHGRVIIHQGFSTDLLPQFDDHTFDWVYLDTGHHYATTAAELRLCRQKVKAGGIIAGHDYVTGSWRSDIRYGVIEAVHEFCIEFGWEMIYLTHESGRHLSYALRRMQDAT